MAKSCQAKRMLNGFFHQEDSKVVFIIEETVLIHDSLCPNNQLIVSMQDMTVICCSYFFTFNIKFLRHEFHILFQ